MWELVGSGGGGEENPRTRETLTAKTAKTLSGNPVFSPNDENPAAKTAKTPLGFQDRLELLREKLRTRQNPPTDLERLVQRKLEKASRMGLVATWSRHPGYVSLHDPTSGEWHDLRTGDAPEWAVQEARRRKKKNIEKT